MLPRTAFSQRKIQDHACALAVFWNVAQAQIFAVPDTEACYLLLPEIDTARNLADADEAYPAPWPLPSVATPTSPPLACRFTPQCGGFRSSSAHTSSMHKSRPCRHRLLVYLEDYIRPIIWPTPGLVPEAVVPLPSRNGSRNPVAHGHHFLELMGDKDVPCLGQIISDLLQFHDFLGREYSGGLIEDQNLSSPVEGFQDLDSLLHAHRDILYLSPGIYFEAVSV